MVQNEKDKVVETEEKKKKTFKNSSFGRFLKDFFIKLSHEKLYLFSFILTIFFVGMFFNKFTSESEGFFQRLEHYKVNSDNKVEPTIDAGINGDKNSDVLDVSSNVGVYSREISLPEAVEVADSCSISSYKVLYKINKDKSIYKYFYNDCIGTIRIWNDTLKYNITNSARYISANGINYLFSNTGIKEVDGETYRLDEELANIKENKILNGVQILFVDSNVLFVNDKRLLIIKGNSVVLDTMKDYKSNGGSLDRLVYNSKKENTYNFIVFTNEEALNCYENPDQSDDKKVYSIYSITYDKEKALFEKPQLLVERKVNEGCKNWNEDYKLLQQ